ncbi:unnamed protein product [Clonostachys rosea]|uniref:Heterokaryon incompatibility domain-containing protein n=1 Tax=Bionectria ochroleuca TaxID=29856 RepID=A0ABY6V1P8_BIOOC|nr:unnamed protein product [Clonostachys rosea]
MGCRHAATLDSRLATLDQLNTTRANLIEPADQAFLSCESDFRSNRVVAGRNYQAQENAEVVDLLAIPPHEDLLLLRLTLQENFDAWLYTGNALDHGGDAVHTELHYCGEQSWLFEDWMLSNQTIGDISRKESTYLVWLRSNDAARCFVTPFKVVPSFAMGTKVRAGVGLSPDGYTDPKLPKHGEYDNKK